MEPEPLYNRTVRIDTEVWEAAAALAKDLAVPREAIYGHSLQWFGKRQGGQHAAREDLTSWQKQWNTIGSNSRLRMVKFPATDTDWERFNQFVEAWQPCRRARVFEWLTLAYINAVRQDEQPKPIGRAMARGTKILFQVTYLMRDEIDAMAKERHITRSDWIREALSNHLINQREERAIT